MKKFEQEKLMLVNLLKREGFERNNFTYFLNLQISLSSVFYTFKNQKEITKLSFNPVKMDDKIKYDPWVVEGYVAKGKMASCAKTGLYIFKYTYKEKEYSIFYSSFFYGISTKPVVLCAASSHDMAKTLSLHERWSKVGIKNKVVSILAPEKPKLGSYYAVYKRVTVPGQEDKAEKFSYVRKTISKLFSGKIYHPQLERIHFDIEYFFDDFKKEKRNLRFNMPGIRKVMMIGEPGTGKTSIMHQITKKYGKTHNILYCSDMRVLVDHTHNCAENKIPTIVFFDDAETSLVHDNKHLLGFLDGETTPRCDAGMYVLFSSNKPQYIDARITKRPGRIDEIFDIGPLEGSYAMNCAQQYFKGLIKFKEETDIFNKMTGAQIKGLVPIVMRYAISKNEDVTIEVINKVIQKVREDFKMIDDYVYNEKERSALMETAKKSMGYAMPDSNKSIPDFLK